MGSRQWPFEKSTLDCLKNDTTIDKLNVTVFYILFHYTSIRGPRVRRKQSTSVSGNRPSEMAERFARVLDVCFQGDQTALAAALGCSQSLVSRIVRGVQAPGLRLVNRFAMLAGVDQQWALTGKGAQPKPQALLAGAIHTLPVVDNLIDPCGSRNLEVPSPNLRIVTSADYAASRYLYRVAEHDCLKPDLVDQLLVDDFLLIEMDSSYWTSASFNLNGRYCVLRLPESRSKLEIQRYPIQRAHANHERGLRSVKFRQNDTSRSAENPGAIDGGDATVTREPASIETEPFEIIGVVLRLFRDL
jgi:hypothetical protein